MSASGKVITALRDRLELERNMYELLEIHSEAEFMARARRIAEGGVEVIAVLLRNLERSDPRQLNALGTVASMYPHRGEILSKLYEAAADIERSDRERVSAMLILDRFLDQEPDPYLLQTLDDPRAIALESVRDLLYASEQDPSVLIEYLHALSEQPPEAITGVIDTLLEVGEERALPALCLMSQAENETMAAAALVSLGQARRPEAARSLQSLLPVLPPDRRSLGDRSLRKLQFSGVPIQPLPRVDPAWRALVSPIDGQGNQVVWFLCDPDQDGQCHVLGVSLNDDEGIVQAYGNYNVLAQALPRRGRSGQIHRVPMQAESSLRKGVRPDAPVLYMLETDLDYGRRLVREAQVQHFKRGRTLPDAYRLLSSLIWQFDAGSIDESQQQPPAPAPMLDLLPQTARLPYHPFFRGWFIGGHRVAGLAKTVVSLIPSADHETMRAWTSRLAEEQLDKDTLQRMEARLKAMSEWLWRAEQVPLVELTTVAAETITSIPPARHPFTLSMAELGLNLAVHSLQ